MPAPSFFTGELSRGTGLKAVGQIQSCHKEASSLWSQRRKPDLHWRDCYLQTGNLAIRWRLVNELSKLKHQSSTRLYLGKWYTARTICVAFKQLPQMGNLAHLLKLFQESLNHIWASASIYRNAQLSRMPSSVPSSNTQLWQTLWTQK